MIKKTILSTLLFCALILLSILSLPYVLKLDHYKQKIITFIEVQTGLNVSIQGSIRLRIIPEVALTLNQVEVESDNILSGRVYIETLHLNTNLLSLLQNQLQIEEFHLIRPVFEIVQSKDLQVIEDETSQLSTPLTSSFRNYEMMMKKTLEQFPILDQVTIEDGLVSYQYHSDIITFESIHLHTVFDKQSQNPVQLSTSASLNGELIEHIQLNADYYIIPGRIEIDNIHLAFGNSQVNGNMELDLSSPKPALKMGLLIDTLNLDQYLPSHQISSETNTPNTLLYSANDASKKTSEFSLQELNWGILEILDAHVGLRLGKLIYQGILMEDIETHLFLKTGKLVWNLKQVSLMDGDFNANITLFSKGRTPQIQVVMNAINLALMENKIPVNWPFSIERLNLHLDVSSVGESEKEWLSNLSGVGKFDFKNGRFKGLDLPSIATNFTQFYPNNLTMVSACSASFSIEEGLVMNNDLHLETSIISFTGAGNVDLNTQRMRYLLSPNIAPNYKSLSSDIRFPILIEGPLHSLVMRPDVKAIVDDLIDIENYPKRMDAFKGNLKSLQKDVIDQLEKGLGNNFKQLLDEF